jgi:acetyl esterase/lipase
MKRRIWLWRLCLAGGVLVAVFEAANAAEPVRVVKVWPGLPPGETQELGPEVVQPPRENEHPPTTRITNIGSPTLSVYLPPKDQRNGTSVIIAPGGGFRILAWDKEGTEVAEWLNTLGVSAFVLKYRCPTSDRNPSWLAPAQDAQRAVSLVRSQATEFGLDPARIGVLGFSAGGMTAGAAAIKHAERLYPASDAIDKVPCRPDFAVLVYPAYFVDKQGQLKPEFAIDKTTPPMFFVHAFNDAVTCESSVQLFLQLKQAGVESELHVYSKGGHGFGLRPSRDAVSSWPKRCEEWLAARELLKPL